MLLPLTLHCRNKFEIHFTKFSFTGFMVLLEPAEAEERFTNIFG